MRRLRLLFAHKPVRTAMLLGALVAGAAAIAVDPALPRLAAALAATVAVAALAAFGRRPRAEAVTSPPNLPVETPITIEGLHRRAALRYLGLGALGAVPMLAAPSVIYRVVGGIVSSSGSPAVRGAATARTAGLDHVPETRVRQWTMIIDQRYCDGCQGQGTPPQCTLACTEGHYVPRPMEWVEVYEGDLPGGGTQFIPTPCQHCQNPPCVNVCPVGATFSTPEGTVLIDQERCIGCRICMAACPYDRRFFNWGRPPVPPESLLADYSIDDQVHAQRGTVMKCDFCPDMVRDGTLPFCIQACPNDAIWYGDLEEDIATNGKGIVRASQFLSENGAYRLKEHLGTDPRVYYIQGHGELVGRDPYTEGRAPTEWPWVERAEGAATWNR